MDFDHSFELKAFALAIVLPEERKEQALQNEWEIICNNAAEQKPIPVRNREKPIWAILEQARPVLSFDWVVKIMVAKVAEIPAQTKIKIEL